MMVLDTPGWRAAPRLAIAERRRLAPNDNRGRVAARQRQSYPRQHGGHTQIVQACWSGKLISDRGASPTRLKTSVQTLGLGRRKRAFPWVVTV